MKLSWNWLREFIEVPASPEEVEALERVGSKEV